MSREKESVYVRDSKKKKRKQNLGKNEHRFLDLLECQVKNLDFRYSTMSSFSFCLFFLKSFLSASL